MTSGWQGAPYFRRYGRELVSKPVIWSKKNWGRYRRTTPGYIQRREELASNKRDQARHPFFNTRRGVRSVRES